jgi:hypothetical protein
MQNEPLPHERIAGSTEEWQFDTVNNPKAVSRSRWAEQWNSANAPIEYGDAGGVWGIFVAPFFLAIVCVGLAFLPFFWLGFFLHRAGWSSTEAARLVCIPTALFALLVFARKFSRPKPTATRQGKRPYVHLSNLQKLFRSFQYRIAAGSPASLGDCLLIGFAAVFTCLVFAGNAVASQSVGLGLEDEYPALKAVFSIVNLPVLAVDQVPKVANGMTGIQEISIPLFVVALNSLLFSVPMAIVLWPAIRLSQFILRRPGR